MNLRPGCRECGHPAVSDGRDGNGRRKWKNLCNSCHLARKRGWPAFNMHRKSVCERCGFIPEDSCQLDVDHIDGNKFNGDPSNLQTLCANCHRLKTLRSGDWTPGVCVSDTEQLLMFEDVGTPGM